MIQHSGCPSLKKNSQQKDCLPFDFNKLWLKHRWATSMCCVFHYFLIQVLLESKTFLPLLRVAFTGNEKFYLFHFKDLVYLSTQWLNSLQSMETINNAGIDSKKKEVLTAVRALWNYKSKIKLKNRVETLFVKTVVSQNLLKFSLDWKNSHWSWRKPCVFTRWKKEKKPCRRDLWLNNWILVTVTGPVLTLKW